MFFPAYNSISYKYQNILKSAAIDAYIYGYPIVLMDVT